MVLKFKKLIPEAVIPTYAHHGDVGMDFTAISLEYNKEWDCYMYHTGLACASDFNWGQFIFPRSSNRKTDAYLCNSVGIIDTAIYRGEIIFCFKNRTSFDTWASITSMEKAMGESIDISDLRTNYLSNMTHLMENQEEYALKMAPYNIGDKVGQLVMMSYEDVEIEEVDELNETERGANGFGSSGN